MKSNLLLSLGISFVWILVSCNKDMISEDGKLVTKTFGAEYCTYDGTKVGISPGGILRWQDGDIINWYMGTSSTGTFSTVNKGTDEVSTTGFSTNVNVTYKLNEQDIVLGYVLGNSESSVSNGNYTYDYLKVTKGINWVQDGMFEHNTVLKTFTPISDATLKFKNIQGFICFRINSNQAGGKSFKTIKITSNDKKNVAGDVQYTMPTDGNTEIFGVATTDWQTITVTPDASLKDESGNLKTVTDFYIAVLPDTYPNGLRISFFNGTDNVGWVDTKKNIKVEAGRICDLGTLDPYRRIAGTDIPFIWPEECYIVNTSSLSMSKKIWVEFEPEDVSDIEYEISPSGKATYIKGPDEILDGTLCKTCVITPVSGYTSGTLTVTAKLTKKSDDTQITKTMKINVGQFVDLGFADGTLWAYSNLSGSGTNFSNKGTLGLAANYDDYGGYYQWGCLVDMPDYWNNDDYTVDGTNKWANNFGGRYYNSSETELRTENDAAWWANNTWRIPSKQQFLDMLDQTTSRSSLGVHYVSCMEFTSKIKGFQDMKIYLPCNGDKTCKGWYGWQGGICRYSTRNVCPDTYAWLNFPTVATKVVSTFPAVTAYSCCYLYTSSTNTENYDDVRRCGGLGIRPTKKITRNKAADGTAWGTKYKKL